MRPLLFVANTQLPSPQNSPLSNQLLVLLQHHSLCKPQIKHFKTGLQFASKELANVTIYLKLGGSSAQPICREKSLALPSDAASISNI